MLMPVPVAVVVQLAVPASAHADINVLFGCVKTDGKVLTVSVAAVGCYSMVHKYH